MRNEEYQAESERQPKPLANVDKLLARFFDVLIEMDFEQQRKQQMEKGSNEGI